MSAFEKLEKICAKNPTSIVFARLADGLLQQGDVTRAIEVCRQGLRYRPSYVAGHVIMGKCHLAAGRFEEARLEFQKVLQLDADHLAALWHLGKIDLHLGWDDLALKHFELAQALDPFSPELAEQILELKGDHADEDLPTEEDAEDLSAVDAADTEDVVDVDTDASTHASNISLPVRDDLDDLVTSLKPEDGCDAKSSEDAPSIATATLAELYVGQGLIREAVAVFEQVVTREPDNEQAIARLEELRGTSQ
jgi:tetratricopeptide (TPR) repeat protein